MVPSALQLSSAAGRLAVTVLAVLVLASTAAPAAGVNGGAGTAALAAGVTNNAEAPDSGAADLSTPPGPSADAATPATPGRAPTEPSVEVRPEAGTAAQEDNGTDGPRPDPDEDAIGWENGYWYDDPIAVNQTDGLNETERAAFVARTMARVERLRGLEFTDPVAVEFVGREALTANRTGEFGVPTDDQLWEAMLIYGEETNATRAIRADFPPAVVGYAAEEGADRVVIANRDPAEPQVSAGVLAHELVHVLQHQHFDLTDPRYERRTLDGKLGRDGIVEGEAAYVQGLYGERCGAEWDCVGGPPLGWSGADKPGPTRFYRVLVQPYSDGAAYVAALRAAGGWEAVDAAHEDPPPSTEVVIHRGNADDPEPMTLENRSRAGWEPVGAPQTVGEAGTHVTLWRPLFSEGVVDQDGPEREGRFDVWDFNDTPTAGWGNDRLQAYADGDRRGYVWTFVWDTEADAREFVEAYRTLLGKEDAERLEGDVWRIEEGPFADAFRVTRSGRTVEIVNGPTVADLADIRPPAAPTPSPSTAEDTPTPTPAEGTPTATSPAGPTSDSTPVTSPEPAPTPTAEPNPTPTTVPGFGVLAAAAALLGALRLWSGGRFSD